MGLAEENQTKEEYEMNFDQLDKLAFKYMGKRKSHKEREIGAAYYHGKRVANGVIALRKRLFAADSMDDILRCAGMFHDIGKGIEPHNHTGAVLVRDLLKDEMSESELEQVCRLIEVHCDRKPQTDAHSWDEKLLQDADLLDHYGSQGIWMSISYYAYTTQQEMNQVPDFYHTEWQNQIAKHRNLLNFDLSKQIFDDRTSFEMAIAERMEVEKDGIYFI